MVDMPEGRGGRMLALLLSAIGLLFVWLVVVTPLRTFQAEEADHLAIRTDLLARMQILVARLPDLQAETAARASGAPQTGLLLQGQTDAVASAELQQSLQRLVQDLGGRLISVEMLPTEPVGAYRRIALRVSLQVTYSAAVSILRGLAAARPAMVVDNLKLQALGIRNDATPLDASFTVSAFRAGGSS